ncbi:MAG: hypothetical protein QXZ51_03120 [Candidatus Bathyarchaeia archaeon]
MPLTKYDSHAYFSEQGKANSLTCSECGEVFQRPILATFSANGLSKTYYACPRCLTKVKEAPPEKERESGEVSVDSGQKVMDEHAKAGGECPHFFGFLKKRPKNMPIPDECLTCNRMIECLT